MTTITLAQIEAFRREALAAGDTKATKRADQALAGNKRAIADVAAMIADAKAQE